MFGSKWFGNVLKGLFGGSTKAEEPKTVSIEIRDLTTLVRPFIKPLSVSGDTGSENRNSLQIALDDLMETLREGMIETKLSEQNSDFLVLYDSFEAILVNVPDQMHHGDTSISAPSVAIKYIKECRNVFEIAAQNLNDRASKGTTRHHQDLTPNTLLVMADKLRRTDSNLTRFLEIYSSKLEDEPDDPPPTMARKGTRPRFLGSVPRR